jgi:hypothetical protein
MFNVKGFLHYSTKIQHIAYKFDKWIYFIEIQCNINLQFNGFVIIYLFPINEMMIYYN